MSQARAVISVCGPLALEVLAKGSSLDLRPGRFALDCCAQSTLARAQMLLHRLPHDPTCPCWRDDDIARPRHFEIYVARSYLRYVLRWLDDASFEYRAASMP